MRVRVLRDQQPDALHLAIAVDPELCIVPTQVPRFEQAAHCVARSESKSKKGHSANSSPYGSAAGMR